MNRLLHKLLYRILPLGGYLQTVSAMFFLSHRLGIGRHAPAATATSTPWNPWRRSVGCWNAT